MSRAPRRQDRTDRQARRLHLVLDGPSKERSPAEPRERPGSFYERPAKRRVVTSAVLHTWTRALLYHPHVHLIVTAGGLSADRTQWIPPKHPAFLVPVQALSVLVRAKMCAALKRAG